MWSAEQFKLCYVSGPWAWFTTRDLDKQWGDDWDDAPYEHNAGPPYGPCWHNDPKHIMDKCRGKVAPGELCREKCCIDDWNDDGTPKWAVCKIAFDAPRFQTPADVAYLNSSFSVQDINNHAIAWLYNAQKSISILAGCNMDRFIEQIQMGDGNVYLECTRREPAVQVFIDHRAIARAEF